MKRGHLFIMVAPSGAGKRTVIHALLELIPGLAQVKTVTTRAPRDDEHGPEAEYHFFTIPNFLKLKDEGGILESNRYSGNWYGTPKQGVDEVLDQGKLAILQIDVHGALALKELYPNDVTTIFLASTLDELKGRLERRGANTKDEMEERLGIARQELARQDEFDFVVANREGKLDACIQEIDSFIRSYEPSAA